jgi:hypothetical protein
VAEPDVKDLKERLNLIVDRRNQLVHEDDAETAAARAAIDDTLVSEAIDFLSSVQSQLSRLGQRALCRNTRAVVDAGGLEPSLER